MVTFIVLATVLGTLYGYMLSIYSSNGVWKLPFSRELIGYGLPLLRLSRSLDNTPSTSMYGNCPPVAKNLKVIANFKSGLMDCLNQVWFFVILGPTT
ncbi:hypothetical protein DPMN_026884 [Dreissena polymorpha]|uniref:Uncharacterized protein n=1 Tax=Dreissena polymorpha TaxID=45954 RepID=A0A9D4RDX4_DREPO|nr:hypothetical protein DPMN_026884 [Dreissena polymorpha]